MYTVDLIIAGFTTPDYSKEFSSRTKAESHYNLECEDSLPGDVVQLWDMKNRNNPILIGQFKNVETITR